ncbi:hypothetical protein COHA_009604 [Chlorella ohadii]|uniref:Uncharacterized protein n=1 Tax=Chlorella ohadii TaxID=2649997 RepID=A0AAD5GXZ2_9CHLO|nr:hypothetical protein COHA_009604 [Chlorella ohadii]
MAALHTLFSGNWRAAADAAAEQLRLLQLADQGSPELQGACQQLAQTGLEPELRLALVTAAQQHSRGNLHVAVASLDMLRTLLGSWPAAAEAALADHSLLGLRDTPVVRRIVAGLSTAGLYNSQLLRLAQDAACYPHRAEAAAAIAEQLHSSDWRSAALKLVQAPALANSGSLDRLQRALRTLQQLGAEVANDRGRERVLQYVGGDLAGAQAWRITVPAGTPAEERQAAAEAALEAAGFRAVGGRAAEVVSQLVEGSIAGFQMMGAGFGTWR